MFTAALANEGYKQVFGHDRMVDFYDTIKNNTSIALTCGKNSSAAFQIVVFPDCDGVLSVDGTSPFSYYGDVPNFRIKAVLDGGFDIKLSPVDYVCDDGGLYKADIILPTGSVLLKKDITQPVYIEIPVGKDATSGTYSGTLKLYRHSRFDNEELFMEFSFTLTVKDVVIPDLKASSFHLDLWQHCCNIARKHEALYWSDRHFEILEGYVKSLADLGQKAVTVIASEIPWSGQHCYRTPGYPSDMFEYSMVKVRKTADGFTYDYSAMQKYIDLCFKYGIDAEIEVFGLMNIWLGDEGFDGPETDFPDAIRIRYFDETDGCYKYMRSSADIENYIKSLEKYFLDTGVIDKVLVAADEPGDVEKYRKSLSKIKEIAPSFKFKAALNHTEFLDEFSGEVTDIVPLLNCVSRQWDSLKKHMESRTGRTLWYVCCTPAYPNTFIGSALAESRLIPILTHFMGFDGFLRWNYTVWPENPRERLSYKAPNWSAGDTNFVYPSRSGDVLLSLRYKCLKRGLEDYALLEMAKERGINLDEIYDKVIKTRNISDFDLPVSLKKPEELFSIDYNDYEEMRNLIFDALEG